MMKSYDGEIRRLAVRGVREVGNRGGDSNGKAA